MNASTNDAKPAGDGVQPNQLVGVIVLGALGFLLLVRLGFRGLVVSV